MKLWPAEGYFDESQKLMEAGFKFSPNISRGSIHCWSGHGVSLFAAMVQRDMTWKFRAKADGVSVPSPVFTEVDPLFVWMRVEGWIS